MKQKSHQKKHYEKYKDDYIKRARAFNIKARERNRQYVMEYKNSHPCSNCNENNWMTLDFAHVNRGTKLDNVATLAYRPVSIKRLQAEIDKCKVLCANCHRIETYKENAVLV